MTHTECSLVAIFVGEMERSEKLQNSQPKPIPVAPQTGPHLEDTHLYQHGTEPYEFGDNTD